MAAPVRAAIVGAGGMARYHIPTMLENNTEIVVVCEPSEKQYTETEKKFNTLKVPVPPNEPDLKKMLDGYADKLDAVFIITPHAYHHDQTQWCMEAGLDVLLEKPMVMNAGEAESLIAIRDRTKKLLVVAFQGGLSPQIRYLSQQLRAGKMGELLNVSGTVWQDWKTWQVGQWRTDPVISGGGFLFDTGAHILNSICDIVGEDFAQVAAWLDNRGTAVDITGTIMARSKSGVMVTINACGDTIPSCASIIKVVTTEAIVDTGMWGERLLIQRRDEKQPQPADLPPMRGAWEQFLDVRSGKIANPCPPEVGLRMAKLWDAVQASAKQNGAPVSI
jgi:predicted dehydrogenase